MKFIYIMLDEICRPQFHTCRISSEHFKIYFQTKYADKHISSPYNLKRNMKSSKPMRVEFKYYRLIVYNYLQNYVIYFTETCFLQLI